MAFRYERRPPSSSCTACGRPLWGEDVAVVRREGTLWERLVRLCWPCCGGRPLATRSFEDEDAAAPLAATPPPGEGP
jgi:hypothetical protein